MATTSPAKRTPPANPEAAMHSLLNNPNLMDCRRLFLRDYEVWINIGVHDFEKKGEQRVLINVDLYIPLAVSTPVRDALAEVVDYDFIRSSIARSVGRASGNAATRREKRFSYESRSATSSASAAGASLFVRDAAELRTRYDAQELPIIALTAAALGRLSYRFAPAHESIIVWNTCDQLEPASSERYTPPWNWMNIRSGRAGAFIA